MLLLQIIGIGALFLLIHYLLMKLLRKSLKTPKMKITNPKGKKMEKFGDRLFRVLVFIAAIFNAFSMTELYYRENPYIYMVLFVVVFIIGYVWKIIVEWKYLSGTKEYVISMFTMIYGVIAIYLAYGYFFG